MAIRGIGVQGEVGSHRLTTGGSALVCSSVPEPGFPGGRPNAGLIRLNIASAGPDPEQVYDFLALERVILHETLHILGIGGFWHGSGYLRLDVERPEFTGPRDRRLCTPVSETRCSRAEAWRAWCSGRG